MIPYGRHYIDEDDIQSVVNTLRSGFLTQGPTIDKFETAFAHYVGAKYAVAVSSCTAGLHLSVIAAGMGPGDTLITSPITFVASANAGLYVGGNIAFADIDSNTINMDPSALSATLEDNPGTKVVVPVHFAGLPCEMESIKSVCDSARAVVVEDAAHALGATYKNGQRVGSCCYSLMTVFSLHPVKAIAAGEGGIVTTNDPEVYRKLLRLRSHGINKLDDAFCERSQAFSDNELNPWYYEMQELGYHYRFTDIQSALALSQLNKLPSFLTRRKDIASSYISCLQGQSTIIPAQPSAHTSRNAHHLFVVNIRFQELNMSRANFMNLLRSKGIGSQVHYIPVPMHPYYKRQFSSIYSLPNAFKYYEGALSLPCFYSLTDDEQSFICETLLSLLP